MVLFWQHWEIQMKPQIVLNNLIKTDLREHSRNGRCVGTDVIIWKLTNLRAMVANRSYNETYLYDRYISYIPQSFMSVFTYVRFTPGFSIPLYPPVNISCITNMQAQNAILKKKKQHEQFFHLTELLHLCYYHWFSNCSSFGKDLLCKQRPSQ